MNLQEKVRKQSGWVKFGIIISIVVVYLTYIIWRQGIKNGLIITLLLWAFVVCCTPVADAGFLIALALKFVSNVKIQLTQFYTYLLAAFIIIVIYYFNRDIFTKTPTTKFLLKIIENPFTLYGLIIVMSFVGTILSAVIEDEIYNYIVDKKIKTQKQIFITYCVVTFVCWIAFLFLIYKYKYW